MPVKKLSEGRFSSAKKYLRIEFGVLFFYSLRWLFFAAIVGVIVGSASALFLETLNWATSLREQHLWIIAFLPLAGLLIGLAYHYWGKDVVKGNNMLIEQLQNPNQIIPLVMAPLIFAGTVITHLFGGSAGREGTAVQIGGAFADQFTKIFKLKPRDRKIILICGISAGFASVFGTPLAGAIFGLEVFIIGSMVYNALLPSFIAAFVADYACKAWGVGHTQYFISLIPDMNMINLLLTLAAGIIFGLIARSFSALNHRLTKIFSKIKYPPLRPLVGGIILVLIIWSLGTTRYIGLGIPVILESFTRQEPAYTFAIKLILTALTLSAGFKGGEVTPLFFIGATLGSCLSLFIPLPYGLLAGMGFVAVFSGAANTPIACIFMGLELFGIAPGMYIAIACITAYMFSGHTGIYHAQIVGSPKHLLLKRHHFKG